MRAAVGERLPVQGQAAGQPEHRAVFVETPGEDGLIDP